MEGFSYRLKKVVFNYYFVIFYSLEGYINYSIYNFSVVYTDILIISEERIFPTNNP